MSENKFRFIRLFKKRSNIQESVNVNLFCTPMLERNKHITSHDLRRHVKEANYEVLGKTIKRRAADTDKNNGSCTLRKAPRRGKESYHSVYTMRKLGRESKRPQSCAAITLAQVESVP